MKDSKQMTTPMAAHSILSKEQSPQTQAEAEAVQYLPYQAAVGALMFAMLGTRPDIAFAVTCLSQFSSNFGAAHWTAVKRVLRYLRGTLDYGISYQGRPSIPKADVNGVMVNLIGFCDADWGHNLDDRRSVTGYLFKLCEGAISWQAKKQPTVALSSVEAEYMAATQVTKEAIWWNNLLSGLALKVPKPILIHSDSQGAIALTKNPGSHSRTKHIAIQHHFVREQVEIDQVVFKWIPTEDMPADLLTKPLSPERHRHLLPMLGMARSSGSVEDNDRHHDPMNEVTYH